MHSDFSRVPRGGKIVNYLSKKFIVFRNVFRPFEDSKALVRNWVINRGESVLDVGTGSGVLAVMAVYCGAKRVVALDRSRAAVKNAKINAALHGFSKIIEVRISNVFSALESNEKFDVIVANLPFRNYPAKNSVERTTWDQRFKTNRNFFGGVRAHLKKGGRIYITQANFGEVESVRKLTQKFLLSTRKIGENPAGEKDPRIFYAFELRPKI